MSAASVPLVLSLPPERCTTPRVQRLREFLAQHPGDTEIQVELVNGTQRTLLALGPQCVTVSSELLAGLATLLGPSVVPRSWPVRTPAVPPADGMHLLATMGSVPAVGSIPPVGGGLAAGGAAAGSGVAFMAGRPAAGGGTGRGAAAAPGRMGW